jgi:hypothetical protein
MKFDHPMLRYPDIPDMVIAILKDHIYFRMQMPLCDEFLHVWELLNQFYKKQIECCKEEIERLELELEKYENERQE